MSRVFGERKSTCDYCNEKINEVDRVNIERVTVDEGNRQGYSKKVVKNLHVGCYEELLGDLL